MTETTTAADLNDIWTRLANADPSKVLRWGHEGCSRECEATTIHFVPASE